MTAKESVGLTSLSPTVFKEELRFLMLYSLAVIKRVVCSSILLHGEAMKEKKELLKVLGVLPHSSPFFKTFFLVSVVIGAIIKF